MTLDLSELEANNNRSVFGVGKSTASRDFLAIFHDMRLTH